MIVKSQSSGMTDPDGQHILRERGRRRSSKSSNRRSHSHCNRHRDRQYEPEGPYLHTPNLRATHCFSPLTIHDVSYSGRWTATAAPPRQRGPTGATRMHGTTWAPSCTRAGPVRELDLDTCDGPNSFR